MGGVGVLMFYLPVDYFFCLWCSLFKITNSLNWCWVILIYLFIFVYFKHGFIKVCIFVSFFFFPHPQHNGSNSLKYNLFKLCKALVQKKKSLLLLLQPVIIPSREEMKGYEALDGRKCIDVSGYKKMFYPRG